MNEFLQDPRAWVLFSFVIFLVAGIKLGKKAVLGFLDQKIAKIRQEIDTAEALKREAQDLLAQYEQKQRDAAQEAETIVETARRHALQIRQQAEKELDETMARREKQLAERLERMEQAAVANIRAHAANLAVRATTEIIAGKMDEKTSARLADDSIRQVAGRLR